ncbi:haloacid dehalogenase type II [Christiangramia sp. SM2212]|uniref:Haloacid dehalogenase type II n=1 Tax=Christiangramia sediminicola TaxID=3073267 RepID=A0ABU1ES44_9FLAO|nr:haloacid dehalogenase type II [Christiangramia sp. SM2212]MDR5591200.1 haloacid dehalogenase type II [Christiangramia sp. SM2212]
MKQKLKTLIFDVNETLLDLEPLKTSINNVFGRSYAADIWFSQFLHYSLVESMTNTYHDFSEIAAAVLKMNAENYKMDLSKEKISEILSPIGQLKAYPDVKPGLSVLKENGFQLVAFSNGKTSVLNDQIKNSCLVDFFDLVLSVDAVKKYKPHPETYHFALKQSNSEASSSMMVAAHGWDVTGAMRAGLKTAFIQRPGKSVFPLSDKPDVQTTGIDSLAELLLK